MSAKLDISGDCGRSIPCKVGCLTHPKGGGASGGGGGEGGGAGGRGGIPFPSKLCLECGGTHCPKIERFLERLILLIKGMRAIEKRAYKKGWTDSENSMKKDKLKSK